MLGIWQQINTNFLLTLLLLTPITSYQVSSYNFKIIRKDCKNCCGPFFYYLFLFLNYGSKIENCISCSWSIIHQWWRFNVGISTWGPLNFLWLLTKVSIFMPFREVINFSSKDPYGGTNPCKVLLRLASYTLHSLRKPISIFTFMYI